MAPETKVCRWHSPVRMNLLVERFRARFWVRGEGCVIATCQDGKREDRRLQLLGIQGCALPRFERRDGWQETDTDEGVQERVCRRAKLREKSAVWSVAVASGNTGNIVTVRRPRGKGAKRERGSPKRDRVQLWIKMGQCCTTWVVWRKEM